MLKFNSLMDAISYHPYCYFCRSNLIIDNQFLIQSDPGVNKIVFDLYGNNYHNTIIIDVITGEVEGNEKIEAFSSHQTLSRYIHTPRILYEYLDLKCIACRQFAYTLALSIDLKEYQLLSTVLSSESIYVTSKDMKYFNIINDHRVEKTIVSISTHLQNIKLPLIPFNFSNPQDTIDRINKLIIFT